MVTVCARHGAQHDCLNDRAGVACELWLPGDGPTGDGDGDLEAAVYAIESTAHAELEDEQPSDYYVSEPAIDIDDPVTRGVLDAIARDRGFSRDRGPSDTPTLRTMDPSGTVTDADSAVWTFELAGIQDFGVGSLGAALRAAAGTGDDLDVEFQPKTGTGQDKAVFTIRPINIPFGGDAGAFRTFDTSIPVIGTPVFSQSV